MGLGKLLGFGTLAAMVGGVGIVIYSSHLKGDVAKFSDVQTFNAPAIEEVYRLDQTLKDLNDANEDLKDHSKDPADKKDAQEHLYKAINEVKPLEVRFDNDIFAGNNYYKELEGQIRKIDNDLVPVKKKFFQGDKVFFANRQQIETLMYEVKNKRGESNEKVPQGMQEQYNNLINKQKNTYNLGMVLACGGLLASIVTFPFLFDDGYY